MKIDTPPDDPLPLAMTYERAARELSCSPDTVRDLVAAGELRAVKIRSLVRITRADLEAFLARASNSRCPAIDVPA